MSRLEGRNWKLHVGDCLDVLRTMPDESVHCCVTSPPYWGLRDYGIDPTEWPEVEYQPMSSLPSVRVAAMKSCLGLEPTPEAFVSHVVLVFREVRRVLRHDGTLWLNLGDSYAASGKGGGCSFERDGMTRSAGVKPTFRRDAASAMPVSHAYKAANGLKPKDLVGIPWRVAFALQADGWYLRQDIIWEKLNPMPESVRDRCTKAHEYVFLMSKSQRYFYDAEAIKEPATGESCGNTQPTKAGREAENGNGLHRTSASLHNIQPAATRNRRSVWTVATQPFSGAHFATFPPKLIEPCILAGTSDHGCCASCGAPWGRVVEKADTGIPASGNKAKRWGTNHTDDRKSGEGAVERHSSIPWNYTTTNTVQWQPTCDCETDDVEPCTVLDPFTGSGTTLAEAVRLNRRGLGIELNPEYAEQIAKERISKEARQPVLF